MKKRIFLAQETFRLFVSALSYVGEIQQLPDIPDSSLPIGSYLYALTFLDQEVSFCCLGYTAAQKEIISNEFRAEQTDLREADTIFVDLSLKQDISYSELNFAKIGTLIDPQKAATLVISIEKIKKENKYQLSGPGIQNSIIIGFPKELKEIMLIREELNNEYPLGVDMIISDSSGQMMALPRTTVVMEVN